MGDAEAAAKNVELPDEDATDIPLITVDPSGSRDLDQALHISAIPAGGYLVSYAIADLAAFVRPGSALDDETQTRGETLYFPDGRVPLHPPQLSEGAASLLPGQLRPAVLWRITLDDKGNVVRVDVRRARVKSREQWDYASLQDAIVDGQAPDAARLLPAVGRLRLARARERHAINLDLPEQEVDRDDRGEWSITLRTQLEIEAYNAELSLLTGICAASLMLELGYGILRTVPAPDDHAVAALRRVAPALGVHWPAGAAPGDVLSTVDRNDPRHVAFLDQAVSLLRGAAYVTFDGAPPSHPTHAGIGATYTHVTAPLRRLVDRYANEICLCAQAKVDVPPWVRARIPQLPVSMAAADHRSHLADRAVVDATEAWLLQGRVGEDFDAVVLEADERNATVSIEDPVVRARCTGGDLEPGSRIRVRLIVADPVTHAVRFEARPSSGESGH